MKIRNYGSVKRFYSSLSDLKAKICVVGSGPAGFYSAQHLVKKLPSAEVDIYEKLPVPFGLVRYGVAPDHPEVKNVINTFTKTAQHPNVRFVGNVSLGSDVHLRDLLEAYHVVLLSYGAEENRKLNIPGENLRNVIAARNIVGWYNGVPCHNALKIDLQVPTVAIFGQGNVAIDVARILLTPIDVLKKTDITQHALDVIATSKVKEVFLIGRRGPLQAAFTIKELREMLKLKSCATTWRSSDFINIEPQVSGLARPRKRLTELMLKSASETAFQGSLTSFKPIFFRSPLEFIGPNGIEHVKLCVNQLDPTGRRALSTDETETVPCNLAVTSIGYKSIKVDQDLPFNEDAGIARNVNGKISDGLYTTGWLGTGPTGVIVTTMNNAFATAEQIVADLSKSCVDVKPGYEFVANVLKMKGVQIVSWADWLKIDSYEQAEGARVGKPREKIVDIEEMLRVAA